MQPIERVLTLWDFGLLDGPAVVRWADEAILRADCATLELIDLACYGPEACMRRSRDDFPARPLDISFSQAFALKALAVDLESDESASAFAQWAAVRALGEDLSLAEVLFCYRLDHLISDCDDPAAATALVRSALPGMLGRCRQIAEPFLIQEVC